MPYQNKNRRKIEAARKAGAERRATRIAIMQKLGEGAYSREAWARTAAQRALLRPAPRKDTKMSIRSTGRHFILSADTRSRY